MNTANTVQCASCHLATTLLAPRAADAGVDLTPLGSQTPRFRTLRELGYFVDTPLVIGANDVVNPAAQRDPSSPIYGMPVLKVELARRIIVLKRGKGAGFAGIENDLFTEEKTSLLFGDAKATLQRLLTELKTL